MGGPYRIFGVESSPYTIKVRAVFRYRHIPHQWICRFPQMNPETAHVRPALMPTVQFPDGSYRTDSTPIIYELESIAEQARSVIPTHPGFALLSHLIEDMSDEWLTKSLFHYRFAHETDSWFAARWVVSDAQSDAGVARPNLDEMVRDFRARQISRMGLVGCTPVNAALLEDVYHRVLCALVPLVGNERFLFGTRPSLADFGLYGQLKTLAADPTPLAIMRRDAPFVEHWVRRLDDASGVTGDWDDSPDLRALEALLRIAGEYYLPFLSANAEAVDAGRSDVVVNLAGNAYTQPAFRYQRKCLSWLRSEFESLSTADLDAVRPLLERTGCWTVLSAQD
ncbi:MAG: glutathione S-transferase C-terminal domain-containing protein [Gammaproteobacteria bacterium]|nr:glutathione S-transferase C-terminal domain-containing protein [Gammaproteobacteria bacterium]